MNPKDRYLAKYGDLCDLMPYGAGATLRINGYDDLARDLEAAQSEMNGMQIACDAITRLPAKLDDDYAPIEGCSKEVFDALWERHERARTVLARLMAQAMALREKARDRRHAANPLAELGEGP